ncbi:hypothetical protein LFAB_00295 [Lactiplantibacillus fabifermentans T30PCM01]|nr:hypothetical protein [Lactiplantibacillus fabifermentans]ETY75725.1 hypothetical protein LFAB_00295 [Lactiplantibacillus fabifermentans T30PCM01]
MYDLTYDEVVEMCNNRMGGISPDDSFEKYLKIYVRPVLFKLPEIRDSDAWEAIDSWHEGSEIELSPMSDRRLLIETNCVAENIFQTRAYAIFAVRILKLFDGVISENEGLSWQTRSEFKDKYQPILTLSRKQAIKLSAFELINFAEE